MSRKEQIVAELDALSEDDLRRVLAEVQRLADERRAGSVMARLREIRVEGPPDLASEHDAYASGFDATS